MFYYAIQHSYVCDYVVVVISTSSFFCGPQSFKQYLVYTNRVEVDLNSIYWKRKWYSLYYLSNNDIPLQHVTWNIILEQFTVYKRLSKLYVYLYLEYHFIFEIAYHFKKEYSIYKRQPMKITTLLPHTDKKCFVAWLIFYPTWSKSFIILYLFIDISTKRPNDATSYDIN